MILIEAQEFLVSENGNNNRGATNATVTYTRRKQKKVGVEQFRFTDSLSLPHSSQPPSSLYWSLITAKELVEAPTLSLQASRSSRPPLTATDLSPLPSTKDLDLDRSSKERELQSFYLFVISLFPLLELHTTFVNSRPLLGHKATGVAEAALACGEWGAFHVTNHGVPPKLLNEIRRMGRTFFEPCPMDEKLQYSCDTNEAATEVGTTRLFGEDIKSIHSPSLYYIRSSFIDVEMILFTTEFVYIFSYRMQNV
ncbi:hypothetical protein RJ640_027658 [Escallonia rubra]|uniref:Non-haem dioxygenase N-terminal domain-containing protein n=1 Tax=Escallonia rubra TaxID=112253 RepID=A0AA88RHY2_9ASTE|nr:hypothetical protein RJ640_027658 [Escallonia rubra]